MNARPSSPFRRPLRLALAACAVGLALTSPLLAAPPTDDQVENAVKIFRAAERSEKTSDVVARALEGIDLSEASGVQLEKLAFANSGAEDMAQKFRERVVQLAAEPTADGAIAASLAPRLIKRPGRGESRDAYLASMAEAITTAAKHPGLSAALAAGQGGQVFVDAANFSDKSVLAEKGVFSTLTGLVKSDWDPKNYRALTTLAEAVLDDDAKVPAAERTRIRQAAVATLNKAKDDETRPEAERKFLARQVQFFDGAWAKGELLDHAAPPITFTWNNQGKTLHSFGDLRGKIVVVDFWATWCGPCIASFPHLREMVDRYKDSPVVVLGVTSPQGRVSYPKNFTGEKTLEGKRDITVQDEIDALAPWTKAMDMTWLVAVSEESCFNPQFGVRGIPSMAIIDASGTVRHAGMHPSNPGITDKIDALLKDMGEKVPTAPAKDEKDDKAEGHSN
ncbi:MAG: TlpA family protein disulfide reductase [Phycisphaerales bacterium]